MFLEGLCCVATHRPRNPPHVRPSPQGPNPQRVERVLVCVFPADFHAGASRGCSRHLTVKPGGGAASLRPAHPASSRYQRGAQGSVLHRRHTHTHTHNLHLLLLLLLLFFLLLYLTEAGTHPPGETAAIHPLSERFSSAVRAQSTPSFIRPRTESISGPPPVGLTVRAVVCMGYVGGWGTCRCRCSHPHSITTQRRAS